MKIELKIEGLSIEEANLIFAGLDKLPYGSVNQLVSKLKAQFQTQLAVDPNLSITD